MEISINDGAGLCTLARVALGLLPLYAGTSRETDRGDAKVLAYVWISGIYSQPCHCSGEHSPRNQRTCRSRYSFLVRRGDSVDEVDDFVIGEKQNMPKLSA